MEYAFIEKTTMLIGVCAPNRGWTEDDYRRFWLGRFQAVKLMSYHLTERRLEVDLARLRRTNPGLAVVVRPGDDGKPPQAAEYLRRYGPAIERLRSQGFRPAWELWNEPNLPQGGFGFEGDEEGGEWAVSVIEVLRRQFPGLELVSPGLAPQARDLEWLDGIFGSAVAACESVGVHCYWRDGGMLDPQWGWRLQEYARRFPDKRLHLTEFGNLSPGATKKQLGTEYAAYYRLLRDRMTNVVASAHAFMLGGTKEWDTPNEEHGALLFDDRMAAEVAMVERYNQDERPPGASIRAIVLHCTDGTKGLTPEEQLAGTLNWFQNPASQASAHYVIGRDGRVVVCVPEERRAWHAGIMDRPVRFAWLEPGRNPNDVTLGIELVGYADEEFTTPQYRSLMRLLAERTRQYDIPVTAFHILGHHRLYSQRTDPGALFDWARVFAGIGAWYQRWLREAG